MALFTFNNTLSGSAYFVFSLIPKENGIFPKDENQHKYISGSSFTNLENTNQTNFVVNDYLWAAIIPPGISSFTWGPSDDLEIPIGESKMLYTGIGSATILSSGEEFSLPVSNRWVTHGEISPGDGEDEGIDIISNAFAMLFSSTDNNKMLVDSQIYDVDTEDFSYSTWFRLPFMGDGVTSPGNYNERALLTLNHSPASQFGNVSYRGAGNMVMRRNGVNFYSYGENGWAGLQFRWYGWNNENDGGAATNILFPSSTLPAGGSTTYWIPDTWYHYAVRFKGATKNGTNRTKVEGFVNGQLVATQWVESTTVTFSGFNTLSVGSLSNTDFILDETAFFTSSLSDSEIESIYSASLPLGSNVTADLSTLKTPPVAWYRMGD